MLTPRRERDKLESDTLWDVIKIAGRVLSQ